MREMSHISPEWHLSPYTKCVVSESRSGMQGPHDQAASTGFITQGRHLPCCFMLSIPLYLPSIDRAWNTPLEVSHGTLNLLICKKPQVAFRVRTPWHISQSTFQICRHFFCAEYGVNKIKFLFLRNPISIIAKKEWTPSFSAVSWRLTSEYPKYIFTLLGWPDPL